MQATARDILMYAMKTLRHCEIVAHVHDEIIIEADPRMSLDVLCEQMGRVPPWAEGLLLRATGTSVIFIKKTDISLKPSVFTSCQGYQVGGVFL